MQPRVEPGARRSRARAHTTCAPRLPSRSPAELRGRFIVALSSCSRADPAAMRRPLGDEKHAQV